MKNIYFLLGIISIGIMFITPYSKLALRNTISQTPIILLAIVDTIGIIVIMIKYLPKKYKFKVEYLIGMVMLFIFRVSEYFFFKLWKNLLEMGNGYIVYYWLTLNIILSVFAFKIVSPFKN